MLQIESFTFNPFSENTYVVFSHTKEAIIVDPGCSNREEENQLAGFVKQHNLRVKQLINTHCHIDHVLGNDFVKSTYQVPLLIHTLEEPLLKAVKTYASNYGFPKYREVLPDAFLKEGDVVKIGQDELLVLFVPGHSPGHIALYDTSGKALISGDVLFENSIGRTDLPGGNYHTLIESIHKKLFTLPDDVVVYCGHGPTTTLGFEKRTNPFCALS